MTRRSTPKQARQKNSSRRITRESADKWVRLFELSGQTQCAFAQANGLPVATLRSWIYRHRRLSQPPEFPFAAVTLDSPGSNVDLGNAIVIRRNSSIEVSLPVSLSDDQAKRWLRLLEVL